MPSDQELWGSNLSAGNNAAASPSQLPIEPDANISLDSDNVEEAIDELATDIHNINNAQDMVLLFQNALV